MWLPHQRLSGPCGNGFGTFSPVCANATPPPFAALTIGRTSLPGGLSVLCRRGKVTSNLSGTVVALPTHNKMSVLLELSDLSWNQPRGRIRSFSRRPLGKAATKEKRFIRIQRAPAIENRTQRRVLACKAIHRGRDQRPQFPPPDPHPLRCCCFHACSKTVTAMTLVAYGARFRRMSQKNWGQTQPRLPIAISWRQSRISLQMGTVDRGKETMDGTRTRRTRDRARQTWDARWRQQRFARFLGFASGPCFVVSPTAQVRPGSSK
jgi:hypothetical protein